MNTEPPETGIAGRANRENLRRRFRELAAAIERVHDEWEDAADRSDLEAEKRLIIRETELLAEIDQVVKAFRSQISPALSGGGSPREK